MNAIISTYRKVFKNSAYTGLFWLILRFYVGYDFLTAGLDKWESGKWIGANTGGAIAGFLKGGLTKATGAHPEVQSWYVNLTNNVFLPNATLFANMVAIGEVFVGTALILGVFTKFAALCGATMNLAFLGAGTSSSNPTMMAFQVAMVFAGTGVAFYGIDHYLMPFLKKTLHIGEAEPMEGTPKAPPIGSLPKPRPVR